MVIIRACPVCGEYGYHHGPHPKPTPELSVRNVLKGCLGLLFLAGMIALMLVMLDSMHIN